MQRLPIPAGVAMCTQVGGMLQQTQVPLLCLAVVVSLFHQLGQHLMQKTEYGFLNKRIAMYSCIQTALFSVSTIMGSSLRSYRDSRAKKPSSRNIVNV